MRQMVNKNKVISLDKAITFVTLFFIFFPWLSFSLNSFDAQPWVIITNSIFIILYNKRNLNSLLFLGYMLLIPVFFIAFIEFGGNSLRSFFSFVILYSTLHVFYIIYKKYYNYLSYLLPLFNIIWLCSGIIQILIDKSIFKYLVTVRTSLDRGVTGLAPEPTHYAFYLIFLSWLLLLINKEKPRKIYVRLIVLNILFVLFVAKSSMGFFYCILFAIYLLLSYVPLKKLLKIIPVIIALPYVFMIYIINNPDNRISRVISNIYIDPFIIISNDASINARLSAPVLSMYGALKDFLIPHGFNSYEYQSVSLNLDLNNIFWHGYNSAIIMSGTGSLLYETGWFGVLLIGYSYVFMSGRKKRYQKAFLPWLLLWTFLLGAIPMSFTLIPAIIVAYYYKNS